MKKVHSKIGFLHVIEACLHYSLSLQLKVKNSYPTNDPTFSYQPNI